MSSPTKVQNLMMSIRLMLHRIGLMVVEWGFARRERVERGGFLGGLGTSQKMVEHTGYHIRMLRAALLGH